MSEIKTTFLIMSDSHGQQLFYEPTDEHIDGAIHCGDLTEESKIEEFKLTLQYLIRLKADLKLVIAGNHDFTFDIPAYKRIVADAKPPLEAELVRKTYDDYGEVRDLFEKAKAANVIFLEEGTYNFTFQNGALLQLYASPFTPSLGGGWGFQYHPEQGHDFNIPVGIDVVVTHGPPRGILDFTESRQRAGCPNLFQAVARAQPRLHCFGHIHEGWGAKLVAWRKTISQTPSHFTDIDNSRSVVLNNISQLQTARQSCGDLNSVSADYTVGPDRHTMFVNAALQGMSGPDQVPWIVRIPLPRAGKDG